MATAGRRRCPASGARIIECCGRSSAAALVEIRLVTGRKHQIRVQLSAVTGIPCWGIANTAARSASAPALRLHARRLVVDHPTRHEPIEIVAPLPASWQQVGVWAD